MSTEQTVEIGKHSIRLEIRETVGPPTPYTMLLAESIPRLDGLTVIDIGTGSGILAIVAALQGASRVYVTDLNPAAINAALHNAARNGVQDRVIHLPTEESILISLPQGERLDIIISNPAQLPLPQAAERHSPYYAGPDGRRMIDAVIASVPERLAPEGRLIMVHNSVTDFPKSIALMRSVGLDPKILAEHKLVLRPLFDRKYLDELGGVFSGLYSEEFGQAYETIYAIEAQKI